jgi:deoxyribodipyrimidine photo-lyase
VQRDSSVENILHERGITLHRFKDQVIFEELEIRKDDNAPYTVFTPYKNRWLMQFEKTTEHETGDALKELNNLSKCSFHFPSLEELGFRKSQVTVRPYDLSVIKAYDKYRELPSEDKTSYLGPHLRFGTVSIRNMVRIAKYENSVFLSELIWREFFMQILFNFPKVITHNFKARYDNIQWRNNQKEFERWCIGETGYPLVDAGMRQLNETGFMHNRVRMVTASFLVKHLLINWQWGEAYFAQKLLDFELSSNNGNWQWAAGTGCDAAPYFRVFNPDVQLQKFDNKREYVRKWVKDIDKPGYPEPMIDHSYARNRAILAYKSGLQY